MRVVLMLLCVLLAACNENYNYKVDGPHQKYVESYMPLLKVTRDGVVHQLKITDANIDHLYETKKQFTQNTTKNMIMERINALFVQKNLLKDVLDRIDVEVEKGIAMQAFNQLEGGNTRKTTINNLAVQAQERIAIAQQLNSNIHDMTEEIVPHASAQMVRPLRVLPVR